jgi:hypothetical protein
MPRTRQRGGVLRALAWTVGVILGLLAVGAAIGFRISYVNAHRACIRDVRTPVTGTAVVDVCPEWTTGPSPLGENAFRATVTVTAVPAESVLAKDEEHDVLDAGGDHVPEGFPGAMRVAGVPVEFELGSDPDPRRLSFADGSTKLVVTTGPDGKASVDVRCAPGGGLAHLVAWFTFDRADGTPAEHRWPSNLIHRR